MPQLTRLFSRHTPTLQTRARVRVERRLPIDEARSGQSHSPKRASPVATNSKSAAPPPSPARARVGSSARATR